MSFPFTDDTDREVAVLRLGLLKASLVAIERRAELVETVYQADDRADALQRIQQTLGVTGSEADAVLELPFRRLTRADRDRLAGEYEVQLAALGEEQ